MPAFKGWGEACQRFFIGLELDNSKRYFDGHREVYRTEVRGPMEALAAELEPVYGPAHIFRINRDIRFSADKSPYKTNVAAVLGRGDGAVRYVHLDARSLYVATGMWDPDPARLQRFREAVAGPAGAELLEIAEALEGAGCRLGGEQLKIVPRGFPRDHPHARLLRHRYLTAGRTFELQPWLGTPAAKDHVVEVWETGGPLVEWLRRHAPAAAGRA